MSALFATGLRWLGMPAFLALATVNAPMVAVCLPFVMLPTLGLLYTRQRLPKDRQADLNDLTYIYFGSVIGVAAVILGQGLLTYAIAKPLFGDQAKVYFTELVRSSIKDLTREQIAVRAKLASSWQNWVYLAAMTYGAAGGIEELLKYAPIAYFRRQQRRSSDKATFPREKYIQYAVTAALGFSTIENIGYVRMAVKAGETGWKLALTIFERVVAGGPGHCLTAALLAVNVAKLGEYDTTPRNLWRILGGPILWHGTFDLFLFSMSALNGNVGWVHPDEPWQIGGGLLVAGAIQLALFMHVRRAWRSLTE